MDSPPLLEPDPRSSSGGESRIRTLESVIGDFSARAADLHYEGK